MGSFTVELDSKRLIHLLPIEYFSFTVETVGGSCLLVLRYHAKSLVLLFTTSTFVEHLFFLFHNFLFDRNLFGLSCS